MPAISVIVPVYKVEKYIHRCVRSILGQTYADFELILVDDGSPDNCGVICDEYAAKDSRVVVIHQKNGGLSAARNAGIDWAFANSDSQWITFIDSDDWVHPEYLQRLLDAVTVHNVAVSICGYARTDGQVPEIESIMLTPVLWNTEEYYVEHNVNATVAWGKLYRRECFREIRYPVGKIHEDEFITYQILFNYKAVSFVREPLYYYFNNPNGITLSEWSPRRLDVLEALEEKMQYFAKKHYPMMEEYSKQQLRIRLSLLYLQAYAQHKENLFPRRYKQNFWKAMHNLYVSIGPDRFEAMLVHDYPKIIKALAIARKVKSMLVIPKPYRHRLSIIAIAKFEAPYIKEWVDYHLLQGIDCIYLYDNDSPDGMRDVLEPYICSGKVVYTRFPGKARQLDAYNDAIRRFKNRTKYMAFLDCDEFLVQENPNESLPDVVEDLMRTSIRCAGVAVNWRVYGSSGHIAAPGGLVMEAYLTRGDGDAKGNDCIKTIANPRRIKEYRHVHFPTYYRGFYSVNDDGLRCDGAFNKCADTKRIRLNHYFTKSKEEWMERRSRGKADTTDSDDKRTLEEFYAHDNNSVYDPIMLPYAEKLKKMR